MDFEERKCFWNKKRRSGLAQSEKVKMQEEFVPSAALRGSATSVAAWVESIPLAAKRLGDFVRELQSAGGEKLSALMPSVLDRAFKGEL